MSEADFNFAFNFDDAAIDRLRLSKPRLPDDSWSRLASLASEVNWHVFVSPDPPERQAVK